ncbi:hypothetical protein C8R41DRAFT_925093 [Lentinula lateritia]|uniref:F-box domain-containing protein n=1 Tax=Lentinula lateritia TaxID=40482 RepID=A0ABQ8V2N9_9AGAR|nr:hypothetical protein C8R41DRAFT_925093 [Lentinula lateritia]
MILKNMNENLSDGSRANDWKDVRGLMSLSKIWWLTGREILFRTRVVGSKRQIRKLSDFTRASNGMYRKMWKVSIYNVSESNWKRLGEESAWWTDPWMLAALKNLDLSGIEEVRVCGGSCESDGSDVHRSLDPLYTMFQRMPLLYRVDCTNSNFHTDHAHQLISMAQFVVPVAEEGEREVSFGGFQKPDLTIDPICPLKLRPRKLNCTGALSNQLGASFAIDCHMVKEVVLTVGGIFDLESIETGIEYFDGLEKMENNIYPMIDPLANLKELTITVFTKTWASLTGAGYLLALLIYPMEWDSLAILHLKMTPMQNRSVTKELQNSVQWEQLGEFLMDRPRFPCLSTVEIDIVRDVQDVLPWSNEGGEDNEDVLGLVEIAARERVTRQVILDGLQVVKMARGLDVSVNFEREKIFGV